VSAERPSAVGASKPEPHPEPERLIRDALSRLMIPDYEASAALDVLVGRLEQQRGFLEAKHVRVLRLEGELSGMEQVAERKQAELDDLERRLEQKDEALHRVHVAAVTCLDNLQAGKPRGSAGTELDPKRIAELTDEALGVPPPGGPGS
jgi:predicted nuclease with TOPRIM domain